MYNRSLRNSRTKIHKNLFVAMLIQVIIRLTLYLDQAIKRHGRIVANDKMPGIENTVKIIRNGFVCVCMCLVQFPMRFVLIFAQFQFPISISIFIS